MKPAWHILWAPPLFMLAYVASVGPAVWFYEHTPGNNTALRDAISLVYMPLEIAYRQVPLVSSLLDRYLELFR